jgi:hypothetical protein
MAAFALWFGDGDARMVAVVVVFRQAIQQSIRERKEGEKWRGGVGDLQGIDMGLLVPWREWG